MPPPRRPPAGVRRSRARSAVVTTIAAPPSFIRQQSSRCSGVAISGEASTSARVRAGAEHHRLGVDVAVVADRRGHVAPAVRAWCRTRACGAWRPARTAPSPSCRRVRRTPCSCWRRARRRRSRRERPGASAAHHRHLAQPGFHRGGGFEHAAHAGGEQVVADAPPKGCFRYIAQFSASRGAPPGPGQSIAAPSTSRGCRPASAIAPLTASMTRSCDVRPGRVRACCVWYTPTMAGWRGLGMIPFGSWGLSSGII